MARRTTTPTPSRGHVLALLDRLAPSRPAQAPAPPPESQTGPRVSTIDAARAAATERRRALEIDLAKAQAAETACEQRAAGERRAKEAEQREQRERLEAENRRAANREQRALERRRAVELSAAGAPPICVYSVEGRADSYVVVQVEIDASLGADGAPRVLRAVEYEPVRDFSTALCHFRRLAQLQLLRDAGMTHAQPDWTATARPLGAQDDGAPHRLLGRYSSHPGRHYLVRCEYDSEGQKLDVQTGEALMRGHAERRLALEIGQAATAAREAHHRQRLAAQQREEAERRAVKAQQKAEKAAAKAATPTLEARIAQLESLLAERTQTNG